jgi:2-polyprenyl-6-methoxyphenol hydroxylase-like FAD-dependent oxidoreductase
MPATKPIIICGTGIGGLALAQGLLKASTPFQVYECEPAHNVRSQGHRVRVNETG